MMTSKGYGKKRLWPNQGIILSRNLPGGAEEIHEEPR
jgi:hypothetical protein